uniref:TauD/TfdA-like domain-containing protein n=1 Tax=Haptolina brevifila TaxID=156173 RepID=A0A7S2DAN8_9EUKA
MEEALTFDEKAELAKVFDADGPACVHVINLPVVASGGELPPTPNELMEAMQPIHKDDATSEACLVGAAALVGARCFTFRGFYGDDMVRNFPRKQGAELGWHRDGVTAPPFNPPTQFFRPELLVPELVVIFCLRGNSEAETMIVDFYDLVNACDPADVALLRSQPLTFFDCMLDKTLEPTHVIKGVKDAPLVELRPIERFEPRGKAEVVAAFKRTYDIAMAIHDRLTLSAGELLIVNNKRCSHARSPYAPKSEAISDRWLQNVYASRRAVLWENEEQSYVQWPSRYVP